MGERFAVAEQGWSCPMAKAEEEDTEDLRQGLEDARSIPMIVVMNAETGAIMPGIVIDIREVVDIGKSIF